MRALQNYICLSLILLLQFDDVHLLFFRTRQDVCIDLSPNCASHADKCQTNPYVQENCKKTCNLCHHSIESSLGCVGDAVAIGSQCLRFSKENVTANWGGAAAACAASGGRLAKLEDPQAVYKYAMNNYYGSLVWLDGSPLDNQFPWMQTINSWRTRPEPNGGTFENALALFPHPEHGYVDMFWFLPLGYICEEGFN